MSASMVGVVQASEDALIYMPASEQLKLFKAIKLSLVDVLQAQNERERQVAVSQAFMLPAYWDEGWPLWARFSIRTFTEILLPLIEGQIPPGAVACQIDKLAEIEIPEQGRKNRYGE